MLSHKLMSDSQEKDPIQKMIDEIAAENGAAVVIVDQRSNVAAKANNNSICETLMASVEFAPKCGEFCGKAYQRTVEAGGPIEYECHAGLYCRTVEIEAGKKPLVAIIGRTFLKTGNYRMATSRAVAGDWSGFSPFEIFDNVILAGSTANFERMERELSRIDKGDASATTKHAKKEPRETVEESAVGRQISEPATVNNSEPAEAMQMPDPFESSMLNFKIEDAASTETGAPDPFASSMMNFKLDPAAAFQHYDTIDREAWRSFIPTLLRVPYKLACRRILEFISRHYGIESSLWLQREGSEFETAAVYGVFESEPIRIGMPADDKRIRAAVNDDSPIVLKERQAGAGKGRQIQLFPVVIGGEVRNALGVSLDRMDAELSGRIVKFCRYVASRLEILRLREAVAERERHSKMLKEFIEQLRNIDADNFWQRLITVSAEVVGAERASLLVRGADDNLTAKAAIGARVDLGGVTDLGNRVSRAVLEKAKPVLVTDASRASLPSPPPERGYRTSSFISYPIMLGEKAIATLNFTDKASGSNFERRDIETLDWIAPQIAVAIDRTALRDAAGEYAQLSITDVLTGLLNRRYIEERLTEEMNRVDRTGEPLSFMMIDVDEFKSYNDRYGHPAGDQALEIVGRILKENLRGADVAARYGGEEFSVLLPDTGVEEAGAIAERIRSQVEQTVFPKRRVTVSIGVASRSDQITSAKELVESADRALYRAKNTGRNTVHIYDSDEDAGENVH